MRGARGEAIAQRHAERFGILADKFGHGFPKHGRHVEQRRLGTVGHQCRDHGVVRQRIGMGGAHGHLCPGAIAPVHAKWRLAQEGKQLVGHEAFA